MKIQNVKRLIDILMTLLLILLMAFQATKQLAHEWLGVAMTAIVIFHQILNKKWYSSLFKGKHRIMRNIQICINILLLLSFAITAISGMIMSRYSTPFLSGIGSAAIARRVHLSMSHWSFILTGFHIGMHLGIIESKLPKKIMSVIVNLIMTLLSCCGIYIFISSQIPNYLFMQDLFIFFDYSKSAALVLLENIVMLLTFAFIAYLISKLIKRISRACLINSELHK